MADAVVHLQVASHLQDWNDDSWWCVVDVLPEELRVEGEDGDLVAANEQEGRKVPRDEVQPGHVEQRRYSRLLRQRQRHQDQGGAVDEDI